MLHFLLIILVLVAIWKLFSHGSANGAALIAGLRRLALVLAVAGAGLGGLAGYYTGDSHGGVGGALAGILIGFTGVWLVAGVVIWIVRGFLIP
jgi:hypothetical protein